MSSVIHSSTIITPIALPSLTSDEEYTAVPDSSHSPSLGVLSQNNMIPQHNLNSAFHPRNTKKDLNFTQNKISEALFVKLLITKCKRIAPLWFRGVSSMREKNRGEHKKVSSNFGHNQNEWINIVGKINEMTASDEGDAVVNLLRKLYKELPLESVYWFIHCWLSSDESETASHECVISRGDAKGRMRRIDCGKGSDKVWRLDTVVGMLYHGLPMSSTDTSMMIHTCDEELCVRPQHLRFRATSVALVVVLKALTQAGYTIISPKKDEQNNQLLEQIGDRKVFNRATHDSPRHQDEHVDVYGPFSIEQVERYRIESVQPTGNSYNKLSLNSSDYEMIDMIPLFKSSLLSVDEAHQQTAETFQVKGHGRNSHGVSPTSTASYSSSCSNMTRNYGGNMNSMNGQNNENIFFNPADTMTYAVNGVQQAYSDLIQWSPVPMNKEAGNHYSQPQRSAFLSKDGYDTLRKSLKRKIEDNYSKSKQTFQPNEKVTNLAEDQFVPRQPAKKRPDARTPTNEERKPLTAIFNDFPLTTESQRPIASEKFQSNGSLVITTLEDTNITPTSLEENLEIEKYSQLNNQPYDEEEEELAGIAASKNVHHGFTHYLAVALDPEKPKKFSEKRNVSSTYSSNRSSDALLPLVGASPSTPDKSPYSYGNKVKKSPEFPDLKILQNPDSNNNSEYSTADQANFIKLLRQSPQYQTNPELIEILINMSQQYGSRKVASRCTSSSGIQSVFYDKVFNGSLGSSPVQLSSNNMMQRPEEFPVLSRSPSQKCDSPQSNRIGSDHRIGVNEERRSRPNSTNLRASLRQLSFTPLSVEPEVIRSFRPINSKVLSPKNEEK